MSKVKKTNRSQLNKPNIVIKIILNLFCVSVLLSCSQPTVKSAVQTQAELDSFSLATYGVTAEERVKQVTDSIMNQARTKALMDTIGLHKAPVKVLKATLYKEEYSSYRNIRLTFKNVSKKRIAAIRFKWKGVNAFGDAADMGGTVDGFGGGFSDTPLGVNKSATLNWNILSRDGKKIILAWPYEVAFTDGHKWVLGL